ncbi:MAG: hydrogenase nickel incorporation protein HypB [Candidatus Bathyarchaeota archaeon]|nr:hydrogenase nickel incorporation protein HypB [Candidatus Bathyarchaeum tardum]WGM89824.1 MAG: hydrogenase nickel incorporation protein HypB [Candidatus Bathyarchaeum tardum]
MTKNKQVINGNEVSLELKPGMNILQVNKEFARKNQEMLKKHNVKAIDIMGSIGAGKTSLIEQLVQKLKQNYRIAVFKGDLTTTIDAERIGRHGVQVVTINTGRECHLDAHVVSKAVEKIKIENIDLLIIENVGNLICPAEFPLGTDKRVVVISVTEGPYMVLKHPFTFMNADIMVINKKDLAKTMKIDTKQLENQAKEVKPNVKVAITNALTGEGVEELIKALEL